MVKGKRFDAFNFIPIITRLGRVLGYFVKKFFTTVLTGFCYKIFAPFLIQPSLKGIKLECLQ